MYLLLLSFIFSYNVSAVQHSKSFLVDNNSIGSYFTFDRNYVYSLSSTDVVQRSFKDTQIVRTLRGHTSTVADLFLFNETTLISGATDGTIIHWDLVTGAIMKKLNCNCAIYQMAQFLNDILINCSNEPSRMINLFTGELLADFVSNYRSFWVYGDTFYLSGSGVVEFYQANLTKTVVHQRNVDALVQQNGNIYVIDSDTHKTLVVYLNNGTYVFFTGQSHTQRAFSLAAIGDYLISGGLDNRVILWSVSKLSSVKYLSCSHAGYKIIAYNLTSVFLTDGTIVLCDFMADVALKRFMGQSVGLASVVVYQDYIFSSSYGVQLKEWQISSKKFLPPVSNNSFSNVLFLYSNYLVSCYDYDSILIRDATTSTVTQMIAAQEVYCAITFYLYNGSIYVPSPSLSINKYNVSNGELVMQFFDNRITSVASNMIVFGTYLYVFYSQLVIFEWNAVTGSLIYNFGAYYNTYFEAYNGQLLYGWSPGAALLDPITFKTTKLFTAECEIYAIYYDDISGIVFVSGTPPIVYGLDSNDNFSIVYNFFGHTDSVRHIVKSGDFLYSCSNDGSVKQWNLKTNRIAYSFEDKSRSVTSLISFANKVIFGIYAGEIYEFSVINSFLTNTYMTHELAVTSILRVQNLLFFSSADLTISVWNASNNFLLYKLQTKSVPNTLAYFQGFVFSGNNDASITKWDYVTGKSLKMYIGHNAVINDVLVDELTLYSAGSDNLICRWDLGSGEINMKYEGHFDEVTSLLLYENLFSASMDKTILMWHIPTGSIIKAFQKASYIPGHIGPVNHIIICNQNLISASSDLTIKQWSIENGNVIDTMFGHSKAVTKLSCSGQQLFSGSEDFSVFLWYPVFKEVNPSTSNLAEHQSVKPRIIIENDSSTSVATAWSSMIYLAIALLLTIFVVSGAIIAIKRFRNTISYSTHNSGRSGTKDMSNADTTSSYNSSSLITVGATLFTQIQGISMPGYLELSVGNFRFQKKIAKGGAGSIYLTEIFGKCELYAAKLFSEKFSTLHPTMKVAFDQEVALMDFLKSNRNIAKIVGFCRQPCCLLMKYYERGSLRKLIYSEENIETNDLIFYLIDIAKALQFMHSKFIIHGDLKPDNVLVDHDKNGLFLVLTDFGIAQITNSQYVASQLFQIANLRGISVHYAAPETFERFRGKVSAALHLEPGDLYSFAIVLHEMMLRKGPWSN